MQFTDLLFLFVFLPVLLAVFYLCKPKYRSIVLIVFSLIFYACGSPAYTGLLCISLVIDVGLGCGIVAVRTGNKAKIYARLLLIAGITYNVGIR